MVSNNSYNECASWLEISKKSFINNINSYRKLIKNNALLGCVLKGNAYGHGFYECLRILHSEVDAIFLITPTDALAIRTYEKQNNLSSKRVIVLGAVSPSEIIECTKANIETVIGDENWSTYLETLKEYAHSLGENYKPIRVHLHIDTGLGREGFTLDNLEENIEFLKKYSKYLFIQGVMSHFANVEDVTEQEYALEQIKNLEKAYDIIDKNFPSTNFTLEKHIAQSASSLILPDAGSHLARVGIALYGLWPSLETKISARVVLPELPKLKPVLSWKCKSQSIKKIKQGSFVGYGCTFRAERDLKVCLLPVGYFDGYPRLLSHKAFVLINGRRCKVLGRIMMNHTIVDITEAVHNETSVIATLLGTDENETITAEMLAGWAETINYEIVTRIGAHLKRMVVE